MGGNQEQLSLSIYCLDGFKVFRGQTLISPTKWQRKRVALLLKYVLVAGAPVPRYTLLTEFWPHLDDKAARHNLAVTLYNLRRTLYPNHPCNRAPLYLRSNNDYIELNWNTITFYDAQTFQDLCREGLAALRQGLWDQAATVLTAANKLYQTDFLAADVGHSWLIEERARLQSVRLDMLEHLATALYKLERYHEAQVQAKTVVQLDPCREGGHRLLMRILSALGQRSQAIVQYRECKRLLERELGIQPGPQTNNLYHRIVNGESH
jgi:LuxR family maltose regulon positive regulatory protein